MYDDLLGKPNNDPIAVIAVHCGLCEHLFMAFVGIDVAPDRQPCPFCKHEDHRTAYQRSLKSKVKRLKASWTKEIDNEIYTVDDMP